MLNKSGHSIDPWGTPKSYFVQILTTNFNSNYYLSPEQSVEYPSIPTYKSKANKNIIDFSYVV